MSDSDEKQRTDVVGTLRAFAALETELGRAFARSHRMHPTDASAIVEILTAETHGRVMTPARLAASIGLTTGATSSLLRRLEAAGHIIRRHSRADRRVVTLHSTQAIHDSADAYFAPIAQKLDSVLRDYPAQDLATVTAIVTRLHTALDEAMASTGHP